MTQELASKYAPADVEPQINRWWQEARSFHAKATDGGESFAIVIPPPNVTSALHMGHALNNTLQDVLIRWRRMQGRNALWMPGTDHAGIATQTVVEKRVLQEEGKRRTDFDRAAFVQKIQAWKDEYETRITEQLKAMGCSCDWDRQRFTMDAVCARAVREAFFRLFADGLIYRGKRLVNWDPATQTALADDEVDARELDGFFWYLKYPLIQSDEATERPATAGKLRDGGGEAEGGEVEYVTVATTRPETMLGDTAVAVNPADPRAANLVGRFVRLPIVNRVIPIIADDYVVLPDPDSSDEKAKFSSGFLKVTPAHDLNDWEVGLRHGLEIINVFGPDASISRDHGWPAEEFESGQAAEAEPLLGMSREEACKAVVAWFEKHDLLAETRPYHHSVGHSYRSHVPIEPYLSDQWYVKVTDERLAGAALRAMGPSRVINERRNVLSHARSDEEARKEPWEGKLRFVPERYAKTFQTWHENIRDWCISRQLWWGHQIPVWTREVVQSTDATKQLFDLIASVSANHGAVVRACEISTQREIDVATLGVTSFSEPYYIYVCIREDDAALKSDLEAEGFERDPDVLDTWFSSALWPISTMGWPQEEGNDVLAKWNPSNTLCTAREIITLWVSRMVMFNLYFRGCLPFTDVFIHAMIQDGHGQKMSKSLGNGVDPIDIIHSHGSDAMRFTLASMTTQTQDVRLPVDLVCPFTGQTFAPKFTSDGAGHRVAAPTQTCPTDANRKMVSSYGVAMGKAKPSDRTPLARNTSEKFDVGRNFANKLWNAARFGMGKLEGGSDSPRRAGSATRHGGQAPRAATAGKLRDEGGEGGLALVDRWIVSRLAATVRHADGALERYEFKHYADGLYEFIWRDFCDWYIEAIKPTVGESATQRQVFATVLDVILRLLHPVMPYITEMLWHRLGEVAPQRGLPGVIAAGGDLIVGADWPRMDDSCSDTDAETAFEYVREVVGAIRQVRTTNKVPPRRALECSAAAPQSLADQIAPHTGLIKTLATVDPFTIGAQVTRPDDAAATLVGDIEIYVHGLVDRDQERLRISKRLAEVHHRIKALQGRLNNKGYVDKAPAHLVQQTRDQLEASEKEAAGLDRQLKSL